MKAKVSLAALLLVFFTVAFAGEALAYPDWFSVKTRSWSIQKVGKDPSKKGYYQLRLEITHTNNSKDRVVTNISDKYGKITLTHKVTYDDPYDCCDDPEKLYTLTSNLTLKSSKNNPVTMTPGESHTLAYIVPIDHILNGGLPGDWDWTRANNVIGQMKKWKLSYTYDCAVRSEPERQGRKKK